MDLKELSCSRAGHSSPFPHVLLNCTTVRLSFPRPTTTFSFLTNLRMFNKQRNLILKMLSQLQCHDSMDKG